MGGAGECRNNDQLLPQEQTSDVEGITVDMIQVHLIVAELQLSTSCKLLFG